jgi:hypothetical protein
MPEMKRSIPWTRKKKRKGKIKKVGIGNSFCSKRTRMQHTSNFLKSSKGGKPWWMGWEATSNPPQIRMVNVLKQ